MKNLVSSGARLANEHDSFDYTPDEINDLLTLVGPAPFQSTFRGTVYWFGYAFAESAPSKQRTDFINAIKSANASRLAQPDLHKFIEAPVANLNKAHRLSQFDFFVYPVSGRSPLVSKIIREIGINPV